MSGAALAFSRAAMAQRAGTADADSPAAADTPAPVLQAETSLLPTGAMIWVLVILMIVPEGLDYSYLITEGAPTSGGKFSRMLWLTLLGFSLVVLLAHAAMAWRVIRALNPFLLGFVLLATASVAWSIEPSVTARRMIRIVTFLVAALAFVQVNWHARRLQNVLRPVITAMLLGSVVFGLAWPEFGIHQEPGGPLDGAWRGLTNHKNSLGGLACVGLILWFHAGLSREVHAVPALLGVVLAATCLVLARSSTSLVAAAFTLAFLALLLRSPPALRRYLPWLVAVFVAALLLYSLVILQIIPGLSLLVSPISAITGKDMSLTGRTDIWDIMSDHIRLHPLLGTGYGAYWIGAVEGTPSFDFMLRLDFYPGSAHNGYLEILNDLGALGLLVLFGYIVNFLMQSLRLLPADRIQALLYLALFMQQAIINLSESRWFSALSVDFMILTLVTAALARSLLEQQRRATPASPRNLPEEALHNALRGLQRRVESAKASRGTAR